MVSKEGKPRTIIVNWQPPSEANGKITGGARGTQLGLPTAALPVSAVAQIRYLLLYLITVYSHLNELQWEMEVESEIQLKV